MNKDSTIFASIGVSDEVARQAERAVLAALAYAPEVEHDLEVELSENAEAAGDVEFSESITGNYDYSKSFAEQVDDWKAGRIPKNDTLIVGPTPLLYQQIGLSALPMTIDQTHVGYVLYGNDGKADHMFDPEVFKALPELLENPVAIIESETRSGTSVVVIVNKEVRGQHVMAAIFISGEGTMNDVAIDSNRITTVQPRPNTIRKLLREAIEKEEKFGHGLFFWNKEEAQSLFDDPGVQFPGTFLQDGLMHSIFDAGSPVNRE